MSADLNCLTLEADLASLATFTEFVHTGGEAAGLSETDLGPAYLDIADHPHAIAVGAPRSGRSNFLRVLCRSLTSLYRPEEAQVLVLDPRRTLLGVVQGPHLRDYAYTQSAIREAIKELVAELENRQPPPGTTQEEMMTKTFWSGPEIFVVVDDAGVWSTMDNPLMMLGPHIEGARDTGLHVFAATAVANWNQVAIGSSVLGKLRASLAPVLILDGRRDAGKIVADILADAVLERLNAASHDEDGAEGEQSDRGGGCSGSVFVVHPARLDGGCTKDFEQKRQPQGEGDGEA